MAFNSEDAEIRVARWANILSLLPGAYCGYVAWESRHPGSPGSNTYPGFSFAIILFLACIALGAILNFANRKKAANKPESNTPLAPAPSRLKIHNAVYKPKDGGGTTCDVTECLQKMICRDSLVLDIENHNFEIDGINYVPKDPLFGTMKVLDVMYSFDGLTARAIRPERTRIVLPEDTFTASVIAGVSQIPFHPLQLEALQLTKEMGNFLSGFGLEPQVDHKTMNQEKVYDVVSSQRIPRTQKILDGYNLRFADRVKNLIYRFGEQGYSTQLTRAFAEGHPIRTEHDIEHVRAGLLALAHSVDGVKLAALE